MPGAYRYSATFDRTYVEEPPPSHNEQSQEKNRQSSPRRSLSTNGIHRRSASSDSLDSICGSSGSSTSHSRQVSLDNAEFIPTRVVKKVTAKPAHNPLQFVKVASCPLSRKAEQQAKKKPEHKEKIKDEEEEWQSNLDNWKSRRRKQSEGALMRLEEIRRIELEEEQRQHEQKKTKTKTFSEMMEERAHRPKQYNLHIYNRRASEGGLRLEHDFENGCFEKPDSNDNSSCDRESSDSTLCDSTAEDAMDEVNISTKKGTSEFESHPKMAGLAHRRHSTGNHHIDYNNRIEKHLCGIIENDLEKEVAKEKILSSGGYTNTDSGLDSLSSSQKTGDIADSASDFSQDSGSSLDSDFHHTTGSLTTGVELLEEFSSRVQSFSENVMPNYEQKGGNGLELFLRIWLKQGSENKDFGFVLKGGDGQNIPVVDSVIPGGVGDQAGLRKDDQILAINGECTQDFKNDALSFVVQQASYTGHLDLVIWRAFNNSGCSAHEKSPVDTTNSVYSENIQQKQQSETVEKQISLVSHRKSSFEGELKQKSIIQRTNKDIKPAIDFKEKVSSFERRRSSTDECSTLVSKPVSSKSRPPVPAKPQLQSNCNLDSTSLSSKSVDKEQLPVEERVNNVDTKDKEKNLASISNSSKHITDSNQTSSKATTNDSEHNLYIEDAQQSEIVANNSLNVNSELNANQVVESHSKTNKQSLQSCEGEERYQPQRLINLQPVCHDSGLNIIYDSHPEQTVQITVSKTELLSETKSKSKPASVSQTCTEKPDVGQSDRSLSNNDNNTESTSLTPDKPYDELNEEHSREKLNCQNQSQEDIVKQHSNLSTDLYDIPLNLVQDDILLADLDLSCRKIEPPKEKPPPPPPDESDVESSEKPPVIRASTTKEIKRELWKRRSDFLGIEFENGPIEVDESQLPYRPAIEDILKSERELERGKRQLLEQETMLRLRRLAEEEEIARKEREIIENIEREERERQQQALEMENALKNEREQLTSANQMDQPVNRRVVKANSIQQPKSRKRDRTPEKSSLQQINSVNWLKNEQEKERYIRHQQDMHSVKDSSQQPIKSDGEIKQSNLNSEMPSSSQNNSSAVKDKETNTSSSNKTPSKKMIIRQERERMRREQEVLQKQEYKQQQQMACKPNGMNKDTPSQRISHDQSSMAQISNNVWEREDIICASRRPEAKHTEAKPESDINENGNQEILLQSRPLSKHNLHSLGAAPKAKVLTNEQWIKPNDKVAKRKTEIAAESGYNQYHWLVQEAEIRRITEQKERQYQHSNEHRPTQNPCVAPPQAPIAMHPPQNNNSTYRNNQFKSAPPKHPPTHCALPCGYLGYDFPRKNSGKSNGHSADKTSSPAKPPRNREQLLSVSGRKRCSHCGNELGRGAAMIIESLQLFYHIQCFCCCVCQAQLGNGSCGTDVRVRNNKLHCQHCYSNDEAGLKFSQV